MVTNLDRLLEVRRDERLENPIAALLRSDPINRDDLADAISLTLSVDFQRRSDVPQYPLESGASASDHVVKRPKEIVMRGLVAQDAA